MTAATPRRQLSLVDATPPLPRGAAAKRTRALALAVALASAASCSRHTNLASRRAPAPPHASPRCPATARAPDTLPGVRPEHRTAAYWIARTATVADPDEVVLTGEDIATHAAALRRGRGGQPLGQADLLEPVDPSALAAEVSARLAQLRARFASGENVDAQGHRLDAAALAPFDAPLPQLSPELRVATAPVPLRCGPRLEGFYTVPPDPDFDRNQCSTVRPQEPVLVLARWPNGMRLARTRYALGFVAPDARLSPPVPPELREALVRAPRTVARGALTLRADGAEAAVPDGALLAPMADGSRRVRFATGAGFFVSRPLDAASLESAARPLTRRAFLEEAFRRLDTPYGWGDLHGGIDCSRLVLDVLETFGLGLPRHSADQAAAGSFAIDVAADSSERERLRLLDEANARGIVLLHFPGHIMLYLGRDAAGAPMALHSFAEYLEPCPGGTGATLLRTDRTAVTTLELGRDTPRRAFLERITRITVLGRDPGPDLRDVAVLRPAAPAAPPRGRCTSSAHAAILVSPAAPSAERRLRVVATSTRPTGPVELALLAPDGRRATLDEHALGGPPYTRWADVAAPSAGTWTAVLGDGARTIACERFEVARHAPSPAPSPARASGVARPVWEPRRRWDAATEALYAAFVEQLFEYPYRDDLTWPDLRTLLVSQDHNLLYDHLGLGEDAALPLQPDCADLPYFLRAYFAWKLRLPFGYRSCDGAPPTCGELTTNLAPREEPDDVAAFRRFVLRGVRDGSRSANGRTHPRDDATDLYPIPLARESLWPGAVFADPYGHLLVVTRWAPQTLGEQGMLLAAEAQPDGTVGRRRFWRGSFLFRPEVTAAGAGFKWWRPLEYDRASGALVPRENRALRGEVAPPWSEQQYEGSADDFYDRVESLINPRPLEPATAMRALVDALQESVVRRVLSVQNGEQYAHQGGPVIAMPRGAGAMFETRGPWEDYATPSRDLRLLIAIDAVMDFPRAVRRAPARFDLAAGADVAAVASALEHELDAELRRREFTYVRSDGTPFRLTLRDVVDRQRGLEMAYNPNDCVEARWAAPEGSAERAPCRRAAPADQRARMEERRALFHGRTRR